MSKVAVMAAPLASTLPVSPTTNEPEFTVTVELEPVQVPFKTLTELVEASTDRLPTIEPVVERA